MLRSTRSSSDLDRFFRDVDRLLGDGSQSESAFTPRTDVIETDDTYVLALDVPGVAQDAIRVHYDDGALTISGERALDDSFREARFHRVERRYGRFSRQFTMGTAIDPDAIDASLDDGVLTVRVPKAEVRKPRQIQVGSRVDSRTRSDSAANGEASTEDAVEVESA